MTTSIGGRQRCVFVRTLQRKGGIRDEMERAKGRQNETGNEVERTNGERTETEGIQKEALAN